MNQSVQNIRPVGRIAMLVILSGLAACGGGKSDQEQACEDAANGVFPILNGIECLTGSTGNGTAGKPTDSGATAFLASGPVTAEYEPNGVLDNANPVSIAGARVMIEGSIDGGDDRADHFVFAPASSGNYAVYLCSSDCEQTLETDALSLMVLDQTQTTLAGTAIGVNGEQALSIGLDAGMAYYVSVSSVGATGVYHLAIVRED